MAIELIGKCASHWATLMICSYGEIMSLTQENNVSDTGT